ncbi:EamA family transporter [Vibrio fluvialis]|uniref:EamA family transporter n=1 Tax=Vibrio fluvialis TaxID=676 RepID=UPI001F37ACB0|nr:EamA family transporter [Vibrio fluvialis]MCE7586521.1 EamA family transporter [Vibrio fluvialis]MCE7622993.1 EamA family transporter [Vibrio fluvialis]
MDIRSVLGSLLVVLIWGLNFSVIKFGLEELPPIMFSGLRFLIVAIPAVFFIPFPKTSIWNVIGVGVFLGVLKFSFLFVAMKSDASAGISSLLLQAQVILTVLLSVLLLKEKITKAQFFGIAIAAIGFSLFFFTANGNVTLTGVTLILCAALFWSISNLIMKRIKNVNLLHFMVWASLVPPLPLFAISYLVETRDPLAVLAATSAQAWWSVIYVGYISTLVAFAIWGWLLNHYPSASVTPFALLIPVVGMVSSSLLLDETMSHLEVMGAVLILCGLSVSVLGGIVIKMLARRTPLAALSKSE